MTRGDSFIIKWWVAGFRALQCVSPFQLVRTLFPNVTSTYGFVDGWVVAHLAAAVCAWHFTSPSTTWVLAVPVLGYGALRVFEMVTYNLSVLFVYPFTTTTFVLRSFRRVVVLALHNYCEVVFWFAAAYRYVAGHFGEKAEIVGSADGSLYYSIVTMATVGYGDITPENSLTRWLAISHISVSLVLTLVVIGHFVSLLPKPRSLDPKDNGE